MIKKFLALMCVLGLLVAFSGVVYAASGEGYFGKGTPPDEEEVVADDEDIVETGSEESGLTPVYDDDPIAEISDGEEEETVAETKPAKASRWDKKHPPEKYSEDTKKVIKSYRLKKNSANTLISRHETAAAGVGNKEKAERYESILKKYPMDYLAAYRLAQVSFEMGRNAQALKWINKSLSIYPDYMPARRLKNQIQGALK